MAPLRFLHACNYMKTKNYVCCERGTWTLGRVSNITAESQSRLMNISLIYSDI
jgi:hypothetical protein